MDSIISRAIRSAASSMPALTSAAPRKLGLAALKPALGVAGSLRGLRRRRSRPSVEFPVTRRGRAVCDVSHVWHARACHGHSHERPRHARIPPLISGVILGLSVNVLGPRRIVLKGRDRSNAVSVGAEAVDHGLPVLSDEAGAQLIPTTHRPPVRDAGVICGMKWPQTSRNKFLVDPLRDRGPAVLLEARGIKHSVPQIGIARLSLSDPRAHGLGGHLEPHIGTRGPIPLTITEQGAAGDDP